MDKTPRIFLHQIVEPGLPGGITTPEASVIRADLATLLARPVIDGMGSIPDVDLSAVADGSVLVWDADANAGEGAWVPVTFAAGLDRVSDEYGRVMTGVSEIHVRPGLELWTDLVSTYPYRVYIRPLYGTGPSTIAVGNHSHELIPDLQLPFDPSGSLSSGERTTVTEVLSGLDPGRTYQITAELKGDLRGEGAGAGRSHPSITIHGNRRTRFGGSRGYVRTVSGVDREYTMRHPGVAVTGVTSVVISAAVTHVDGDPKYVGGGDLTTHVHSSR